MAIWLIISLPTGKLLSSFNFLLELVELVEWTTFTSLGGVA